MSESVVSPVRASLWSRFWARAPRQLRFTRAGRFLVAIALAAGLAAMNTGNNLLFFGWGMVLSAIVVSGVLSEATLRVLDARVRPPPQARVGEMTLIPVLLENLSRHMPAFAVELTAELHGPTHEQQAGAPYQLRISPGGQVQLHARFVPTRRGRMGVAQLVAKTFYPFGFFEKSRRLDLPGSVHFWCLPQAVDVQALATQVVARVGEAPLGRAGPGEDYFGLREFRAGDDKRRVHWRRSARLGRWVVVETESTAGREVMLELAVSERWPDLAQLEHAIATWGSLAEALLARGYRVGVWGPGTFVPPDSGERQRLDVLTALAKADARSPRPRGQLQPQQALVVLTYEPRAARRGELVLTIPPAPPSRREVA